MEKALQVYLPYPKSLITQRFGENANPSYAGQGLKGHTAYDWGASWGTVVPNCTANAYCYSVMHKDDPTLMDYRAAFFIVETESGVYEVSYGHLSKIIAVPGTTYQVGDPIGLIGNTGPVYVGQHEVTEAEKDAGSHAGAHLHGPQIRPVRKVKTPIMGAAYFNRYLSTGAGTLYKDANGFYYEVLNYQNGYNGCVSLAPFSTETVAVQAPAQVIVDTAATIIAEAQTLPAAQQVPVYLSLTDILTNLARFLKLIK